MSEDRRAVKLNFHERKVLGFLAENSPWDECYSPFARIMTDVELDRKEVRRACRSLARKGLAEYGRGLWTEDGEVAGSGYCASRAGVAFYNGEGSAR